MKCSKCQRKMSIRDILRYYRLKFVKIDSSNEYQKHFKNPLCSGCSIKNFIEWSEDFADRIAKSKGRKEIGLNTRRKGE